MDTITLGNEIPAYELAELYCMLSCITVRMMTTVPRGGFGPHRSMTFGLTRHRFKGKELRPSWASMKFPEIHAEIFRLGAMYCPHEFTSVHLNHNVTCPPHVDGNNNGRSTVISFGDYEGGMLMVEGAKCNAFCRPVTFDGNRLIHWNTADLIGNKFSLVFYNSREF